MLTEPGTVRQVDTHGAGMVLDDTRTTRAQRECAGRYIDRHATDPDLIRAMLGIEVTR